MDLIKDALRVAEIMTRLAPRAQRYVEHVIKQDGHNVGLSVATGTATNLMVFVLLTVDMYGADHRDFLRLMVDEIERKFGDAKAHITPADSSSIH